MTTDNIDDILYRGNERMRSAARQERQDHATLLPNAAAFAVAVVIAAAGAALSWQSAAAQGAVACPDIVDDAARLACYDRALRPAPAAPAAAAAPTAAAPPPAAVTGSTAPAAAPPPAAPAAAPPPAAPAPSAANSAREPATPSTATAAPNENNADVTALVIVGVRALPGRETTFTAEDGTAWVQTDSQQVVGLPDTPFDAVLTRGALGSYFLRPTERGRPIRVRLVER